MAEVTTDPSVSPQPPAYVGKSIRDMTVDSFTVVNVPQSDPISGSAFLSDDRLVLVSYDTSKLLLLDKDMEQTSELRLPGQPWDVADFGNSCAIVTLPLEMKLVVVDVSARPRTVTTISVDRMCWGVAVVDGYIYVSVHDNPGDGSVLVIDEAGNIRRRIGVDGRNRGKFHDPSYITVGAHGELYVSDSFNCEIWCYSRTGHKRYHVKRISSSKTYGILVDRYDNLLVCCSGDKVTVLKPNGAIEKELLTRKCGLDRPRSLTYRNTDDTLIVTMRRKVRAYWLH